MTEVWFCFVSVSFLFLWSCFVAVLVFVKFDMYFGTIWNHLEPFARLVETDTEMEMEMEMEMDTEIWTVSFAWNVLVHFGFSRADMLCHVCHV